MKSAGQQHFQQATIHVQDYYSESSCTVAGVSFSSQTRILGKVGGQFLHARWWL